MRIRKVAIKNFTAHVDSTFNFIRDKQVDEASSLVIIRAENGTGKTQLFRAIQWALWGAEDGLGKKSKDKNLILSPEWKKGEIDIKVEVEYEIKDTHGKLQIYTLIRTATEVVDPQNPNSRSYKNERVKLRKINVESGGEFINEGNLKEHFPLKLKDIFIMDGESTDNLLKKDANNRRKIKEIITNLLGIDNAEKAISILKRQNAKHAKKLKTIPELKDIAEKTEELQKVFDQEDELKQKRNETEEKIHEFAAKIIETKEDLEKYGESILDPLTKELEAYDKNISDKEELLKLLSNDLVEQLKSNELAYLSLHEKIKPVTDHLETLHDQGEIPKTAQPVLEECLLTLECVCGSGLDPANANDSHRINHITKEIDKHKDGDKRSAYLSETLLKLKDLRNVHILGDSTPDAHTYITEINTKIASEKANLAGLEKSRESTLEKLNNCDEDRIQELSKRLRTQEDQKKTEERNLYAISGRLDEKKDHIANLKKMVQTLQDQSDKTSTLEVEYSLTNLFVDSLIGIKNHRQTIKRQELSDLIGKVFIKLIGSETQGMYKNASIDDSYTLQVHSDSGTHEATWFLNGASLRMLAVTFIWCVTKVTNDLKNEENNSFPRIFDTPTGMISGITRKEYYKYVCGQSADENSHNQLILLTTEAERKECQEILSSFTPLILTISSNHMSENNANEWPETARSEFLSKVCECDSFGQTCKTCARVAG